VNRYSLTHVADSALLRDLRSLLARERATTAELLAHLAEVDARRLYAPAGYPSMFAWCVEELRLSEDSACKRIRAARAARQYPALYAMLADGRLHLSALVMLAPCLTPENAEELLAAATHRSKAGIERLLAERFPQPDLPARIEALAAAPAIDLSATGGTNDTVPGDLPTMGQIDRLSAPGRIKFAGDKPLPGIVRHGMAPLAPGRYGLQLTVSESTYEKLRHAQALLGHAVPSGEVADVLDRALDALIRQLEQRKCAATDRPRPRHQSSANPRHVPAEVRRAVWQRDGGRCTFVSAAGHRCEARTRLEFDHVEPVARGGRATVNGIRLRCRAHNQYAAECAFGAGFMSRKREAAQRAAAHCTAEETRARAATEAEEARARAAAEAEAARVRAVAVDEVVPWLRALGLRPDEARRRAAACEALPDAPLEARVRHALRCSAGPPRRCIAFTPQPVP
jgi:hypothetical protein